MKRMPLPGQIFHSEKWHSSVLMTMLQYYDKNIPIKQSKNIQTSNQAVPLRTTSPTSLPPTPFAYSQLISIIQTINQQTISFKTAKLNRLISQIFGNQIEIDEYLILSRTKDQVINHLNSLGLYIKLDSLIFLIMFTIQEDKEETQLERGDAVPGFEAQIQLQEGERYPMHSDRGTVEMLLTPSMLQDVVLHRKQLKFLSKTSVSLAKKVYEQQEKMAQMAKETEYYRQENQSITLQNHSLKQQQAQFRQRQEQLQQLLQERQRLIQESTAEEETAASIRTAKLHEFEHHSMHLLKKNQEQASLISQQQQELKMKRAEIDRLKERIHHLQKQIQNKNTHQISKVQKNEVQPLKNKLRQLSEKLQKVTQEHSMMQQVNLQLERQLQEIKQTSDDHSQQTLFNFKNSSQYSVLKIEMQEKQKELSELRKKYKALKNNYSQLKIESAYLKERCANLKKDQGDLQHAIIDRFMQMLAVVKQKLQQGDVQGIKDNLNSKKTAVLKRLSQEYDIFIRKLEIN